MAIKVNARTAVEEIAAAVAEAARAHAHRRMLEIWSRRVLRPDDTVDVTLDLHVDGKFEVVGDGCPRCGDAGEWRAMALVCRRGCGVFAG